MEWTDLTAIATNRWRIHKTIANDTVPLQNGDGTLCMLGVVVLDKVLVGHVLLLLDVYGRLDHLAEARGVWVARLECFWHHDG